jgi:hypothetical protein
MSKSQHGAAAPGRRHGAPKNWRQTFLDKLAETSNVTASAEAASISLAWVYKTRREDPQFARDWSAALAEGYDNLEMDLLRHLRTGESKESGIKFDFATAFRALARHRDPRQGGCIDPGRVARSRSCHGGRCFRRGGRLQPQAPAAARSGP